MNKKKLAFLAIMMILIIALSSALFVACDKNKGGTTPADEEEQSETIEPTEGLLISNSDFKVLGTADEYPLTITDWTGAKAYSSGSYPDGVVAGGISLDPEVYAANRSAWDDDENTVYNLLTANGRYGDDDEIKHALMIYMPKKAEVEEGEEDTDDTHGPTAYGYTSKSFTIEKHKVYKLTVDVLTYNLEAAEGHTPGARIYVASNTYSEFFAINTNGEWKTYELYIEGSASQNSTLTLALGLGKYTSSYQEGLTSGYAFFDNVALEAVTPEDYAAAAANELVDNTYVQTTTLKVPNGRFEFGTMTFSSTTAPDLWSFISGNKTSDDPAPTSLAYNATIDVNKFADHSGYSVEYYLKSGEDAITTYKPANDLSAIENLITAFPSQRIGSKVYLLSQHLMTASSVKTNRTITFEKNKTYALSLDVFTYDVHGAGVSLILTGSDGKDIVIKGISSARSDDVLIGNKAIDTANNSYVSGEVPGNTTGGWRTYTFYITGNQYKDYSYNLSVWLGTEGTNSNTSVAYKNYSSSGSGSSATTYRANGTFANGWVFIDELRLTEINQADIPTTNVEAANDAQTLDCSLAGKDSYVGLRVDLSSENLFETTASGNDLTIGHATAGATLDGNGTTQAGIPNGWVSNYDVTDSTNPIIAGGIITDGLVSIDTEANFTSSGGKGTYPAMPYEIATKTAYMIHSSKDSYYEVESAPFTVEANGFYRLSFWVKTVDVKSTSGLYVYLLNADDETLSSFTALNTKDSDEYTSDWRELTFLIRGSLDQAEDMRLKFTLGTGDRWAESTLTSGAAFVSNMCLAPITYSTFSGTTTGTYVKSVDRTSSTTYTFTNGSFDEYNLSDDKLEDGKALKEQSVLAQPTSWTISDATLDANTDGSNLLAGVFELENVQNNLYFDHSTQTSAVFAGVVDAATFDAFYGDEASADYLSSENFDKIAGPNVLAIASKTADKFAVGYASSKFSLSSNGIYSISVYVRGAGATKASVYLTGEAPSAIEDSMFLIENPAADWTKYTFYVEVGSTSVSLSLNVWLGYNNDYVGLTNADDAKSAGAVFFDNVIKKSISEDDLTAARADVEGGDVTKKVISFMTDSFDSLSETVESRATLTSPSNWSSAAGTNQSASNTKSGILYADTLYLPAPNTVEGTDYVSILGKAYTVDDVIISVEEEEEIRSHYDDPEASADQIEADLLALREQKLVELKKNNWFPVSELSAHSGKNLLVINNMKASAYTYTSTSLSFSAESYYKVSVWARTFGLKDGLDDADDDTIGAYIELYLGTKNEEDNPLVFKAQVKDEWTLYTFYVKTLDESVSNVTVKLSLGTVVTEDDVTTGLTAGYAMFDDVTVEKTTEAEYNAAVETPGDNVLTREVKAEESGEADDDNNDDNTPKNKFNLEYLWWMIPTIILGALIIIVVIVFFAKKITKKTIKKSPSTRSKDVAAKKRSRYDENKE